MLRQQTFFIFMNKNFQFMIFTLAMTICRSSTIQDKSGKCLTEEKEILSRWTEYCSELYNYESCGDNTVLDCSQPPEEDLQPFHIRTMLPMRRFAERSKQPLENDELLTLVKKRNIRWIGHVSRSSGSAKTILQGTVKGKRKRGRQKKRWEDNIKEWTGMDFASSTRAAENRSRWKGIVANSSVVPRRPSKVMG